MKERLVKGSNVLDVVRLLRHHQRDHELPDLGDYERRLLARRLSPTTWYSLKAFERLLQCAHRFVYDGSEAAGQQMGRRFAQRLLDEDSAKVIAERDVVQTLERMAPCWRAHFNFGELTITPSPDGSPKVRVQLKGYPDMSACHGQCIVGWALEAAERAGAREARSRIEERPWMHNSVLTFTLQWQP